MDAHLSQAPAIRADLLADNSFSRSVGYRVPKCTGYPLLASAFWGYDAFQLERPDNRTRIWTSERQNFGVYSEVQLRDCIVIWTRVYWHWLHCGLAVWRRLTVATQPRPGSDRVATRISPLLAQSDPSPRLSRNVHGFWKRFAPSYPTSKFPTATTALK